MKQNNTTKKSEETNNAFAYSIANEVIHISEAISGRKGYYCMGCGRQMEAVKRKIHYYSSYFRHSFEPSKGERKCTYSDETYRHKIAKEILQSIKTIKVPAVYKFPPNGKGLGFFVGESKTIVANTVGIQRRFYENDEGEIKWTGKDNVLDEKNLLIEPDVTFFDGNGEPILFIEIVATHKVDDEKRVKLKRLGVDTVQVNLPRHFSPKDIEKAFYITEQTKWIYNNEEQRTKYVPVSEGDSEGISLADELQGKLFRESFLCRQAQIRGLIRSITKCLESKQYTDISGGIESEIFRVETATDGIEEQLSSIRSGIRNTIKGKYRKRRESLDFGQTELITEEADFSRTVKDLEKRYFGKRTFLESKIRGTIEILGGNTKSVETRRRDLEKQGAAIDGDIGRIKRRIEQIKRERNELEDNLRVYFESSEVNTKQEIETVGELIIGLPAKYAESEERIKAEFGYLEDTERREIADCEEFEKGYAEKLESGRRELAEKFEAIREGIIRSIKERDVSGGSEFSGRLKEALSHGELFFNIKEAQLAYRRVRKAHESYKDGAYENWVD